MVKLQFVFVLFLLLVGAPIVELVHKGLDAGPQQNIPVMPWKVGLFYATNATGTIPRYMCTGNILGAHWILTAAHCIQAPFRDPTSTNKEIKFIRPEDGANTGVIITISYGSNNLPIFNGIPGRTFKGNKVSVEAVFNQTVFLHPGYNWTNPRTSDHDIGLIYIPKGIQLGDDVACTAPLELEDTTPFPDGHPIRVAGWGRTEPYNFVRTTEEPLKFVNFLSYADINGYLGQTCVSQFPKDTADIDAIQDPDVKQKTIAELAAVLHSLSNSGSTFCGNDPNVNSDPYRAGACEGDSGGSVDLIVNRLEKSGSPSCCVLRTIGLVSKGFGCGDKKFPDIYQLLTSDDFSWIIQMDEIIQQHKPDEALQVRPPETTEEQHRAFLQDNFSTTQNIVTNNRDSRCCCIIC